MYYLKRAILDSEDTGPVESPTSLVDGEAIMVARVRAGLPCRSASPGLRIRFLSVLTMVLVTRQVPRK